MVIHVTPEIEADVRQRVVSGEYADESEVVREALRELDRWERRVQERGMSIAEGLAAIERGEGVEWTLAPADEIERDVEERSRRDDLPGTDTLP